jgi:hypothetical protein
MDRDLYDLAACHRDLFHNLGCSVGRLGSVQTVGDFAKLVQDGSFERAVIHVLSMFA